MIPYIPEFRAGRDHPGTVVESEKLQAISRVATGPVSPFLMNCAREGWISNVQMDGILAAAARHREGYAFILGDSPGLGKGRQIAGIIADSGVRSLWVSSSRSLIEDARRDFRDIRAEVTVNDRPAGTVYFCTYMSLVVREIVSWNPGLIVFDESHHASGDVFLEKVIRIQEKLPGARIVYASATGFSSVRDMRYMIRLEGFPFPGRRGDESAYMELIGQELKRNGSRLARSLSWGGIDIQEHTCQLTPGEVAEYDRIAAFFRDVALPGNRGETLRAMKLLITTFKVRHVIEMVRGTDDATVISIAPTGDGEERPVEAIARRCLRIWADYVQGVTRELFPGGTRIQETIAGFLIPEVPECPGNFIDTLSSALAPVAEITGRAGIRVPLEHEVRAFMLGRKRVCILSGKGSTGISLHSDPRAANQRRRVHIVLELPWSADMLLQQLGRTHRTGQVSEPRIVFMNSTVPGEIRFRDSLAFKLKVLAGARSGDSRTSPVLEREVQFQYSDENRRAHNDMLIRAIGDQEVNRGAGAVPGEERIVRVDGDIARTNLGRRLQIRNISGVPGPAVRLSSGEVGILLK